jgi:hypothetical protein
MAQYSTSPAPTNDGTLRPARGSGRSSSTLGGHGGHCGRYEPYGLCSGAAPPPAGDELACSTRDRTSSPRGTRLRCATAADRARRHITCGPLPEPGEVPEDRPRRSLLAYPARASDARAGSRTSRSAASRSRSGSTSSSSSRSPIHKSASGGPRGTGARPIRSSCATGAAVGASARAAWRERPGSGCRADGSSTCRCTRSPGTTRSRTPGGSRSERGASTGSRPISSGRRPRAAPTGGASRWATSSTRPRQAA